MTDHGERAARLSLDVATAAAIVKGDEAAFEALVLAHHARLSRIAGRFFRRAEAVEDVVQEALVKAFTGIAGYRGEMPLEHWLSRIAVNACYDQLRRQKARPEVAAARAPEDETRFWERLSADAAPGPGFWEREETRLCAEALLARLAPPERLVLTLLVLEDLPVADVARLTGWSQANVKIRAFRARNKLRKMIEDGKSKGGSR